MTTGPDHDVQTALEDLVSSPGWQIFCEYARTLHGPEQMATDLMAAGQTTTNLHELGALTAGRLSVLRAIDQLLLWPEAILAQGRTLTPTNGAV